MDKMNARWRHYLICILINILKNQKYRRQIVKISRVMFPALKSFMYYLNEVNKMKA
jgi:hypothetical protein